MSSSNSERSEGGVEAVDKHILCTSNYYYNEIFGYLVSETLICTDQLRFFSPFVWNCEWGKYSHEESIQGTRRRRTHSIEEEEARREGRGRREESRRRRRRNEKCSSSNAVDLERPVVVQRQSTYCYERSGFLLTSPASLRCAYLSRNNSLRGSSEAQSIDCMPRRKEKKTIES
uniref:Uncharacterized protein n=1 Tax=Trichogramma kaykai TaxID=54128 RepID=A0ABD2XQU6_9HYME